MTDFIENTVGDLIAQFGGDIKTGPFGTVLKAAEYSNIGVPLISVGEIGYGKFIIHDKTPRISPATVARLPEYVLREGDIVFGRKGAVDRSSIIGPDQAGWFLGSDGIRLRLANRFDARLIGYWMQSPQVRAWLLQHAAGSTMASLNQRIVAEIPVRIPSRREDQTAIANVLSALDDKIELNRRMNETLEGMAQAIFKDWFVDFGPTRRKLAGISDPVAIMGGLTPDVARATELAALFPDALGDDGLPVGWSMGKLADLALSAGSIVQPSSIRPDTPYIGLEHMPRRSIMLDDWGMASAVSSAKTEFKKGQILFGKLRPYFHKVGIAPVNGVASTDIIVMDAKNVFDRALIACVASSDAFVAFTDLGSDGTKMPRTSWSKMGTYPVALAEPSVRVSFSQIVGPSHEKIVASVSENRTLAETRDYLLPKLMSGEVRVKDAEMLTEGAPA